MTVEGVSSPRRVRIANVGFAIDSYGKFRVISSREVDGSTCGALLTLSLQ